MKEVNNSDKKWVQSLIIFIVICSLGTGLYVHLINNKSHSQSATTTTKTATDKQVKPVTLPKVNCKKKKCIAITLDDGPGPYDKEIIKTLNKHNAHATFFLIGNRIKTWHKNVTSIYKSGNEIGNHSWDHKDLALLSKKDIKWELNKTNKLIKKYTGMESVNILRPPYGAQNARLRKIAKQKGMAIINWSVDTNDWKYKNAAHDYHVAIANARKGAIILMHSIYPASVKALDKILTTLKKKGYVFVTISQLFNNKLKPGKVVNKR